MRRSKLNIKVQIIQPLIGIIIFGDGLIIIINKMGVGVNIGSKIIRIVQEGRKNKLANRSEFEVLLQGVQ